MEEPTEPHLFYREFWDRLDDLEALYEYAQNWLEGRLSDTPLIFYVPSPLEDLPLEKATHARPRLVRGEVEHPEPLPIEEIRKNESGIVDLEHYLVHLQTETDWYGALEGRGSSREDLQALCRNLLPLFQLGSQLSACREQARLYQWTSDIHTLLHQGEYDEVVTRLLEHVSFGLNTNAVGYYVAEEDNYELRAVHGFDPEEEPARTILTQDELINLGYLQSDLLLEPEDDGERSNVYLCLESGSAFLGLLVGFGVPHPPEAVSAKLRTRMHALLQLASVALSSRELSTRLHTRILRDDLSGLVTEAYFRDRLAEELQRGERYGSSTALLILEIGEFEQMVGELGDRAGQTVVRETGRIIQNYFRQVDLACRFKDAEFGIMFPHTDRSGGLTAARRFQELLKASLFESKGKELTVRFQGGIATSPEDGMDPQSLIKKARLALYEARQTEGEPILTSQHMEE